MACTVVLEGAHSSVAKTIDVRRGSVITVHFKAAGEPALITDELRDDSARPILGARNDGSGNVSYPGLSAGTYTVVGANHTHYGIRTVHVTTTRTYDVGSVAVDRPTLTLSGTTAPHAVVEAKTGQECPPDGPLEFGVFQFIEKADANGHYEIRGLPPGLYMLGSDGWPGNYAPRCVPDVVIAHSQTRNLPLPVGGTASGRLVYASTGTPVITTLSYELSYPPGSPTNPTSEHPTRDKTTAAFGRFRIDRMAAGTLTGALSQGEDTEQVTSPRFFVIFPFQDGTPYYLTSRERTVDVGRSAHLRLGDIPLFLHR